MLNSLRAEASSLTASRRTCIDISCLGACTGCHISCLTATARGCCPSARKQPSQESAPDSLLPQMSSQSGLALRDARRRQASLAVHVAQQVVRFHEAAPLAVHGVESVPQPHRAASTSWQLDPVNCTDLTCVVQSTNRMQHQRNEEIHWSGDVNCAHWCRDNEKSPR